MDSINNFAISQLAGGITATQLTATVATGQGSRFPSSGAFNVVIYDASYSNAALAYQAGKTAIYRVLSRTGDVLTFKDNGSSQREGQEGTTAIAHNTLGATYVIMQALTAKLLTDLAVTGSTGWINVKDNGAVGDGSQDDTAAIAAAIATIPSTGGVLYFPPGTYKTSGGFTLANPTLVLGCGMGARKKGTDGVHDLMENGISQIECTSDTAVLFTVTSQVGSFRDIALKNIAATQPSAGAAIRVTNSTYALYCKKIDYKNMSVFNFYIGIDNQSGSEWTADNLLIYSPVLYGMKIANILEGDAGDWCISNSNFYAGDYNADAGIKIISSGGGKIINCKFNYGDPATHSFADCINLDNTDATKATIILHIVSCSLENFGGNGININVTQYSYRHIFIANCGIGVQESAAGVAILMNSYLLGQLENIIVNGCVFYGKSTGYAIDLTNINNAAIYGNIINTGAFSDGLVSQTDCTAIVIL